MELKRLRIRNFLGIGEGEITFDKPGVVLVEGVNHDSPSSISNGAGKSSIFEALFWVLFGRTKRGLSGDDVTNNVARKNCRVELEFDDFLVIRTRKDDELGTALLFMQLQPDLTWKDLTRGTARDTQRLIEDTVKMSELAFSKVAYFGQGDIKGFAGLSDGDLKKVFEQALGLTFLGDYQEKVKSHRGNLEAELREMEVSRRQAVMEHAHTLEKMELLRRSVAEYLERLRNGRERIQGEIDAVEREMAALRKETESGLRRTEAELAELGMQEEERRRLELLYKEVELDLRAMERELTRRQTENGALTSHLRKLAADLESLRAREGTPCETCGKPYSTADLDVAGKNLQRRLEEADRACKAAEAEEKRIEGELSAQRVRCEELRERVAALDHIRPRTVQLRTRYEEWRNAGARRAADLGARRRELERLLGELEKGEPEARGELDAAAARVESIEETIDRLDTRLKETAREIEVAKMLEEILGNGGMKSYVFDAITPQLNRLIDRNIKMLDDIDIDVSTVTKLKSGELREKFSIGVRNRHGADIFEGNSGGEMQKINLSISLAINSLVRTIAEGSINAIFLDECFENLDEGSSERVLELIGAIETPNVFLITQRTGIKGLIPTVLKVEKHGGMATIRWA